MKKLQKLMLSGNITPLSTEDEGHLKGGFGEVGTNIIQPRGTNVNCSIANDKRYCNNTNCSCTCKPVY